MTLPAFDILYSRQKFISLNVNISLKHKICKFYRNSLPRDYHVLITKQLTKPLYAQYLLGIPPTPTSIASAAAKKNSSRRNAWGNLSYADLITKAITTAPDNRLTLSQIYEWMVQNVPYFKDKGDSNSSAGWKVKNWDDF